jgi:hypothetical protein
MLQKTPTALDQPSMRRGFEAARVLAVFGKNVKEFQANAPLLSN